MGKQLYGHDACEEHITNGRCPSDLSMELASYKCLGIRLGMVPGQFQISGQ